MPIANPVIGVVCSHILQRNSKRKTDLCIETNCVLFIFVSSFHSGALLSDWPEENMVAGDRYENTMDSELIIFYFDEIKCVEY